MKMNKENILKALEEFQKENSNPYLSGYRHESWSNVPNLNDFKGFTSEEWAVGGRTGGNCWNDGANRSIDAEPEKEITLLDAFLEKFMPNITFLQYKKLTKFFKTEEWTDYQYYGNATDYKLFYITFDDIAECLSKMDVDT